MSNIDELERLQKLKENGTLTEIEFETEKQKILNGKNTTIRQEKKNKKRMAKIFFILTVISAIGIIIAIVLYMPYGNVDLSDELELQKNKSMLKLKYDNGEYTRAEYEKELEKIEGEYNKKIKKEEMIYNSRFVLIGLAGIFLVVGIVLKIREKGGIKIVN